MPRCIFCGVDLQDESPEHIILNALGGRKKTPGVICSICNNKFGSTDDKELAEDFAVLLNLCEIESGDGSPPPTLKNVELQDGTKLDLLPGMAPVFKKVVYLRDKDDEQTKVHIEIPTIQHLAAQLDNFAKGVELTKEQIIVALQNTDFHVHRGYIKEGIGFNIPFGRRAHKIAAAKAMMVLWALKTSNSELSKENYNWWREVICHDYKPDSDELVKKAHYDFSSGPIVMSEHFCEDDFVHYIAVWANKNGEIDGYYRLFGRFGYAVKLAQNQEIINCGILLIQNPLSRKWEMKNIELNDLPDFIFDQDLETSEDDCKRAISLVVQTAYRRLDLKRKEEIIDRAIENTRPDYGEVLDSRHVEKMSSTVAEELVNYLFKNTSKEVRKGEDIVGELLELLKNEVDV